MRIRLIGWAEDWHPRTEHCADDAIPLGVNVWELEAYDVYRFRNALIEMGRRYSRLPIERGEVNGMSFLFGGIHRNVVFTHQDWIRKQDQHNPGAYRAGGGVMAPIEYEYNPAHMPPPVAPPRIGMPAHLHEHADMIEMEVRAVLEARRRANVHDQQIMQQILNAANGEVVALPPGVVPVPLPAPEIGAKEGVMPEKKQEFIPASPVCEQGVRDYLVKHFKKELFPSERNGWSNLCQTVKPNRRPDMKGTCAYDYTAFGMQFGFHVEMDGKKERYVFQCRLNDIHDTAFLTVQRMDDYQYPLGNVEPFNFTSDKWDENVKAQTMTKMWLGTVPNPYMWKGELGGINGTWNIARSVRNPITGERPKIAPQKMTETTIARFLVRQCGVESDDPRLNKLAEHLAQWEARENPGNLEIAMLTGDAITKAYENSAGASSCMVGANAHLTEMYALNKEQVGLALLKSDPKTAIARCLVWFHSGDPKPGQLVGTDKMLYADRIYPECVKTKGMFKKALKKWADENGHTIVHPRDDQTVADLPIKIMEVTKEYKVPYMDTYREGMLIELDGKLAAVLSPTADKLSDFKRKHCTENEAAYLKGDKFWLANRGHVWPAYQQGGKQIPGSLAAYPWNKAPLLPKPEPVEPPQPEAPAVKINRAAEKLFRNAVVNEDNELEPPPQQPPVPAGFDVDDLRRRLVARHPQVRRMRVIEDEEEGN